MSEENNLPKLGVREWFWTEEMLERKVERLVDLADAILMAGKATQAEYDAWMKRLDAWAEKRPQPISVD